MPQPALIVVAGPPGAGKTTLAHALARALRCPAVCRDEIKEGLVGSAGEFVEPDSPLQRQATDAFFDVLALLLGRGVSVVAEAAFQHKVWAPRLQPLRAVGRIRVVLCEVTVEEAISRRVARGKDDPDHLRFHPETEHARAAGSFDPPRLGVPTLRVDTSNGYQPAFETIVEFARGGMRGGDATAYALLPKARPRLHLGPTLAADHPAVGRRDTGRVTMARITGVGGVFIKSKGDGAALAAWYQKHLGLSLEEFGGAVLRWPDDHAEDRGLTVWHVASSDSQWFSPSQSSFMINYRVDNLGELLEQLRAGGVALLQGPESHENGKFAWIMDPDGNKVELWEPKVWDDKNKGA